MDISQGNSRLINWSGRLALLCLFMVPVSVLAVRLGVHFKTGLVMFALSCLLALVLIIVLVIASMLPRYRHHRRQALLNTLPAIPPVLLILALLGSSGDYPPIHDITTNTDDPPLFDAAAMVRSDDANSLEIKPMAIAIQLEHYPDLATIFTDMEPASAYERASAVAEILDWEIYNSDPANGLIEASYTSFWFGFVDDIVIRVRRDGDGSKVDLRSVSRVGLGDLGANAARIRAFVERFPE